MIWRRISDREAHQESRGIWAILAIVIAVIIAVGLVMLADPAEPKDTDIYAGVPVDMQLLELDKVALDQAYHNQLLKLWGVWLTDGAKDPTHFKNGLANARRAYSLATKQIAEREKMCELHKCR